MQTSTASPRPAARRTLSAATTDIELASRAATGDETAFEGIMRRHNRLLFRTARSILRSDAEPRTRCRRLICVPGARCRRFAPTRSCRPGSRASSSTRRSARCAGAARNVIPLESPIDPTDPPMHEAVEDDDPDRQPEQAALRGANAPADGSTHRPAARSVPHRVHAARGRGNERRGGCRGARHSRGHRAHALLPRPQPAARRLVARRRSSRSPTRSRSPARAATASSPACWPSLRR